MPVRPGPPAASRTWRCGAASPRSAPTTDDGWASRLASSPTDAGGRPCRTSARRSSRAVSFARRPRGQPTFQVPDVHEAMKPPHRVRCQRCPQPVGGLWRRYRSRPGPTADKIGPMTDPRAGQPAQPSDLVDVASLVTAYYTWSPTRPTRRSRSSSAPPGTAAPASTPPSTRRTSSPPRRRSASTAPSRATTGRCSSAATPTASPSRPGPRALEVLAANDVTVLVDAADRLHADAGGQPRDPRREPGQDQPASPTASSSPPRTTRPATAGSSTTRPPAGPPTPTRPAGSPTGPTTCCAPGSAASAGCRSTRRAPRPAPLRLPRHLRRRPAERGGHRRDPGRPACGSAPTRSAARASTTGARSPSGTARPDRGQPAGRPHLAVHDAGLGRQDPDGLLVAVGHGLADRRGATSSRSPRATTPTPTGTASSPPTAG